MNGDFFKFRKIQNHLGKATKPFTTFIAIALLHKVQTLDRCLRFRFHENSKIY